MCARTVWRFGKAPNAADYFSLEEVDGALVGGASLKAKDFVGITQAAAG